MRRWRNKSRAMIAAQRFCLVVVLCAGVNWLLNVFHYHWLVRYRDVQVGTWLGTLEIKWLQATPFPPLPRTRFFFGAGGVAGPNGLATVLGHIRWLPHYEEYDNYGAPITNSPPAIIVRPVDHSILTLPLWSVSLLSGVPYVLLAMNARRRRRARLCDVCDYSLTGLPAAADGLTLCPECGNRIRLYAVPSPRP